MHARASPPPKDLARDSPPSYDLDGIEFARPRATSFACVVFPRASIGVGVRFGILPSIAGSLLAIASPEFCFPSVLAGHAALSCIAMTGLSCFDGSKCIAARAVFRYASATRICLRSRSLAAQSDDLLSIRLRRRRESCIAAFLLIGDVPLLARNTRDLVNSIALFSATASLIFRRGVMLLLKHLQPQTKLRPAIRRGCVLGLIQVDGTRGIFSLRRFCPDGGCAVVSNLAGLHAVRRTLAAIYFRRGIVRPKGNYSKKDGRL